MNLRKAAIRAYQTAREHGFWSRRGADVYDFEPWHDEKHFDLINTKLMLIVSEATEAMEEHRMHDREHRYGMFADELADIIIRTCDLAGFLGIDLEDRVSAKMDANEARPARHGGKQF